jgi:hypothetical protein
MKNLSCLQKILIQYQPRGGLGSKDLFDGSKGPWDITYEKIQKAPKIPPKSPLLPFCMGDLKGHCDQSLIATMASPLLYQPENLKKNCRQNFTLSGARLQDNKRLPQIKFCNFIRLMKFSLRWIHHSGVPSKVYVLEKAQA